MQESNTQSQSQLNTNSSSNGAYYHQNNGSNWNPSPPQHSQQQKQYYQQTYQPQPQSQQQQPIAPSTLSMSLTAPPPPPPTYPPSSGVSVHSEFNTKQDSQNIPPVANVTKAPVKLKGFAKQIISANIFSNPSNRDRVNLNSDQQQVLNMTKRM